MVHVRETAVSWEGPTHSIFEKDLSISPAPQAVFAELRRKKKAVLCNLLEKKAQATAKPHPAVSHSILSFDILPGMSVWSTLSS